MPKRTDIDTVIIIGAGPIIIGQACEFDYSGAQACKALREEGYRVVLINSNPATIMTDPEMADATYIEPITPDYVEKIIKKEQKKHPKERMALLPTMGGQTALNTALALDKEGRLERLNIEMIGAKADVIDKAEDRLRFREAMDKIGLESPRSQLVTNMDEAKSAIEAIGTPVIIRPSFTLGGTGGGIAFNIEDYFTIIESALRASPVSSALIEESVLGWKEYEMEVVRDHRDNCIIICSIENIDPMGVHTGDSVTVAPALTLTDKEYQQMRDASIAVLREIGVDTGGSNVQFAVNPKNGRQVVIEMNPRVSRSSALASKATGFPIAKVAAKLAIGYSLDELANDITGTTPASFEPSIDYIVTKMPRFAFEKFPGAVPELGTAMKSVGEAMAIGRNFAESIQKLLCSMETGLHGFNDIVIDGAPQKDALLKAVGERHPQRLLRVAQAMRHGVTINEIHQASHIDKWFLEQIATIIAYESDLMKNGLPNDGEILYHFKSLGFSDARIAKLTNMSEDKVRAKRLSLNVTPIYKRIDSCAGEFISNTFYMYSSYEGYDARDYCESDPSAREKIIILGGGPNRIGQGIEFDYCCVHAAYALREAGYETIMINCNPETVSTDYDTSDRLYFEPLSDENVLAICYNEQKKGKIKGVIVQYGGQTPLKLSQSLEEQGIPILGTAPDKIDLAEDRERFQQLITSLDLLQPRNDVAYNREDAIKNAHAIGYPVVLRPSYVLGGRGMEIVHDQTSLERYIDTAVEVSGKNPVLIDQYLRRAVEVDVDVISDGESAKMIGLMEHIEEAGIHSGDSACALPAHRLDKNITDEIKRQSEALALALNVVGLMNVQYAISDGKIYILEVNPRASRTVPFVAKARGIPLAKYGALAMAGQKLSDFNLESPQNAQQLTAVKEAVFPFNRFDGVDVMLGPEMRSTGEVMGLDKQFPAAFAKAQIAAGAHLPIKGNVFFSIKDDDKQLVLEAAKKLRDLGLDIIATKGTADYFNANNIATETINKVLEGAPHIVDAMKNGDIHLVFNTTGSAQAIKDSFSIRRTALLRNIPYYTTIAGINAAADAVEMLQNDDFGVCSLQEYYGK